MPGNSHFLKVGTHYDIKKPQEKDTVAVRSPDPLKESFRRIKFSMIYQKEGPLIVNTIKWGYFD